MVGQVSWEKRSSSRGLNFRARPSVASDITQRAAIVNILHVDPVDTSLLH